MSIAIVVDLFRGVFLTTFWISLPILAIGFMVGAAISLFQIMTSMQDSAFSTAPRLAAFLFGLLLLMPWMLSRMVAYTTLLFGDLQKYAR
jgi:flagellar biosynthesis protein FliQ